MSFSGSLYYDELLPDGPPAGTAVLVHGGSLTGACYLSTPDGRPGWAPAFAARGYRVLVPDWPGTGRSATVTPDDVTGELVCAALGRLLQEQESPVVLIVHSMSGPFGFRLLATHSAHLSALVALAPGPPGDIQPEPTVLRSTPDELEIQGEYLRWRLPRRGLWWPTEAFARTKMIGASTRFPSGAFDAFRRQLVPIPAGLLSERQNVDGRQLRTAGPVPGTPALVLTGDHDTDHPREADAATARWLADLGAAVTHRYLDDAAHTGNGHLLMSEDNSDELAELVIGWLEQAH
ncbi:alpha/beta fold hydrolase [Amycolatopsis sp. FDAARGOS 1241]|uniref:alpha/beta fold hydrolase n=1 Tax=Amycolatopsis sp. FDAARGOS 1241 TaxID=2778070 RepID=UPI00194F76D7|nr:alpha/beta fold hydrolase [Amycolatopsis sp. FDAARGOS 1241]QRP49481.1 alpha/beta fold hydrolase [Amycolatopsis sp. FDAARGOS 1241]